MAHPSHTQYGQCAPYAYHRLTPQQQPNHQWYGQAQQQHPQNPQYFEIYQRPAQAYSGFRPDTQPFSTQPYQGYYFRDGQNYQQMPQPPPPPRVQKPRHPMNDHGLRDGSRYEVYNLHCEHATYGGPAPDGGRPQPLPQQPPAGTKNVERLQPRQAHFSHDLKQEAYRSFPNTQVLQTRTQNNYHHRHHRTRGRARSRSFSRSRSRSKRKQKKDTLLRPEMRNERSARKTLIQLEKLSEKRAKALTDDEAEKMDICKAPTIRFHIKPIEQSVTVSRQSVSMDSEGSTASNVMGNIMRKSRRRTTCKSDGLNILSSRISLLTSTKLTLTPEYGQAIENQNADIEKRLFHLSRASSRHNDEHFTIYSLVETNLQLVNKGGNECVLKECTKDWDLAFYMVRCARCDYLRMRIVCRCLGDDIGGVIGCFINPFVIIVASGHFDRTGVVSFLINQFTGKDGDTYVLLGEMSVSQQVLLAMCVGVKRSKLECEGKRLTCFRERIRIEEIWLKFRNILVKLGEELGDKARDGLSLVFVDAYPESVLNKLKASETQWTLLRPKDLLTHVKRLKREVQIETLAKTLKSSRNCD